MVQPFLQGNFLLVLSRMGELDRQEWRRPERGPTMTVKALGQEQIRIMHRVKDKKDK